MSDSREVATMRTGGQVGAIIPQTIDEVFRVASGVRISGLAPYALVGRKPDKEADAAIAIVIMSGAELGLKPMAALRSFTVINGKPALYGDGLINVVRQSGKVKRLKTGCDERDGQLVGWCEAERSDTGETSRVEFSQDDAIRAGLWQTEAFIDKEVWEDRRKVLKKGVPNDSPWYKYPKRMLAWRAAGYCLRELFGDVLGGVRDEFEAREIADAEFVEVQPERKGPPSPPPAPEEPEEAEQAVDVQGDDVSGAGGPSEPIFDFERLDADLSQAGNEEEIEEVWDVHDVEATLTGDEDALQRAFDIKRAHLSRVETFPGDA